MPQTQWGRWSLNTNNACLEISMGQGAQTYQVPLEEMTNSAAILDWVFQIQEKTWASSADVGDLVGAVADIFGRSVAGGGLDTTIDPKKTLADSYGIKFP